MYFLLVIWFVVNKKVLSHLNIHSKTLTKTSMHWKRAWNVLCSTFQNRGKMEFIFHNFYIETIFNMCTFYWYMICSKYKGIKPFKHPLKNFNQEGYGRTDGRTETILIAPLYHLWWSAGDKKKSLSGESHNIDKTYFNKIWRYFVKRLAS